MSEARAEPRASSPRLATAADEHPLRQARRERGISAAELAKRAGCSESRIYSVETGILPSVALAARLAATMNMPLSALFGEPGVCQCSPGCNALTLATYAEHHAAHTAAAAGWERRRLQLEKYMRAHDLISTREAATQAGCQPSTICEYIRAGLLTASIYPDYWPGRPPYLLRRDAIEHVRELLATASERHTAASRRNNLARWAARRAQGNRAGTIPRRGHVIACPDCGRSRYYGPAQLARLKSEWCIHCERQDRNRTGRGVKHLICARWSGPARQRWIGRWHGGAPPGPGAPPRGRPRGYTDQEAATVIALRKRNPKLGERPIAARFGLSKRQVHEILTS